MREQIPVDFSRSRSHRIIGLCALILVFALLLMFWPVLFGGELYYPGDTARQYLPSRLELVQALQRGQLPWWTTDIGAGYPLLAEGEVGAMYPLHWLVVLLFSPEGSVSASIILHSTLVVLGMWFFLRSERVSALSAIMGSMVVGFGGFYVAHVSHLGLYCASVWLPWMLWLISKSLHDQSKWSRPCLAVIVALQFYAGHAQASALSAMLCAAWLVYRWGSLGWKAAWRNVFFVLLWVVLGIALALPQLLPTFQLTRLSQRAGGLSSDFFTSYSFHPGLILTFLHPFVLGNPYPTGSVEVMGYVGLLTVFAAVVAVIKGRLASRWFWLAAGFVGLVLALGEYNPFYRFLSAIPVLNLFRVPARYLVWVTLSLAVLSAQGMDCLLRPARRWRSGSRTPRLVAVLVLLICLIIGALVLSAGSTQEIIDVWPWVMVLLFVASAATIWLVQVLGKKALLLASLVLFVDLYGYGVVLGGGFNATVPAEQVTDSLQTRAFLEEQPGKFRVITLEEILPTLSVQRESLFPNMALGTGVDSANLYMPLVPQLYADYVKHMDAAALNRLNVEYVIIPQLLPVDEASELYDVQNPYSDIPYDVWIDVENVDADELVIESYLSHSVDVATGTPVAVVELMLEDGSTRALELRAGIDTAEWAYARSDVRENIAHALPPIYSTFKARSGFPPENHDGYTYRAAFSLDVDKTITSVRIVPLVARAFVRVESVSFVDSENGAQSLEDLIGMGNHSIVYRSEDALVYRNSDVWPRAFAIPGVMADGSGTTIALDGVTRDDLQAVDIVTYEDTVVELAITCEKECVLVLADMVYPGWQAYLDGMPVETLTVDGLFRGVRVSPGAHSIKFVVSLHRLAISALSP